MPPKQAAPKGSKQPPTKRRAVALAKDADVVLTKCRELRDSLRKKSEATSDDDDEWGISSDEENKPDVEAEDVKKKGAKTQRISLAELKRATSGDAGEMKTIVEVAEMNSTQVVEGIENVAVRIARQVLDKQVSCFRALFSDVTEIDGSPSLKYLLVLSHM